MVNQVGDCNDMALTICNETTGTRYQYHSNTICREINFNGDRFPGYVAYQVAKKLGLNIDGKNLFGIVKQTGDCQSMNIIVENRLTGITGEYTSTKAC
ncbi:hypothetical protein CSQ89_13110 [Chitinimonas sp. BJB300]|nr:hypothetical protein CSQ89_13110 [Chitinimonas sp. BJB300]